MNYMSRPGLFRSSAALHSCMGFFFVGRVVSVLGSHVLLYFVAQGVASFVYTDGLGGRGIDE